ncbi:2Fe-2S iron-sulfur cluster-binding protein [Paraburkholderia caribensis]|uniref:2Fe-2S iron-sulfur cluster-binding protein n=1 Tax=Paraburkholderia caribensis TaxID=75105 RepID=A0A9Q6S7K7_9BURK|nr:2Fe-2S iron-sulfur cluster-binding protein [Paraburkholderia caribensis]MCO4878290.1 2Fe-2S iron-sulfur cluster-binding protein [Paraburkholderia caribensis]PTB28612.1 hypothetical protein C9I56_11410 [Paraburkholderia caribensis]QLB66084.1 hypothetical protein A9O66_27765 [Paraburkholderia caribensis]
MFLIWTGEPCIAMKLSNVRNETVFDARATIDIVSASMQAGCAIDHSCRRGICGQCNGLVLDGTFSVGIHGDTQTVSKDGNPASVLMCQTFPRSDLTIDCREKQEGTLTRPAQIDNISFPTPEVAVVDLKLMDEVPFDFKAGQFVAIRWTGDRSKYFSLASRDCEKGRIQLHIRRQKFGEFTTWLFENAQRGDILGLDGPFGTFTWSTPNQRPVILLATGTGFSPIKSLVETHQLWNRTAPVYLYWGGFTEQDIYQTELAQQWSAAGTDFHFVPVLAAPTAKNWSGRMGYLQECVAEDHQSLVEFDVYACGSPAMIEAARKKLVEERGLIPDRFFTDSFNSTRPLASNTSPLTDVSVSFEGQMQGRIHAETGQTLLQVLLRAGLNLDHYCGGGAVCGTCKVRVEPPLVDGMNEDEADLLECLESASEGHRLACQMALCQQVGSHTIHLPGSPGRVSGLED